MRRWALALVALVVAVLVVPAAAAPPRDSSIDAAARKVAPPGSRIALAWELNATFGVVAYVQHGRAKALAMRCTSGGWKVDRSWPTKIRALEPGAGAVIGRKPTFVAAWFGRRYRAGGGPLWLDGRFLYGHVNGYWVWKKPTPGWHTVVTEIDNGRSSAGAYAWRFRVR
jgi:hypothetical protein